MRCYSIVSWRRLRSHAQRFEVVICQRSLGRGSGGALLEFGRRMEVNCLYLLCKNPRRFPGLHAGSEANCRLSYKRGALVGGKRGDCWPPPRRVLVGRHLVRGIALLHEQCQGGGGKHQPF